MKMMDAIEWHISKSVNSYLPHEGGGRAELCGCPSVADEWIEEGWLRRLVSKRDFPQKPTRFRRVVFDLHQDADLTREFQVLAKQWKEETFPLSSLTKKYSHPAYQRIMAMGKDGIGLVLQELQQSGGRWFYALKFMAGEDVSSGVDNFEDAKAAWLAWGYKNRYL